MVSPEERPGNRRDSVALAAIQGLYEIVQEKNAEIESLRAQRASELAQRDVEIASLNERISRLEHMMVSAVERANR